MFLSAAAKTPPLVAKCGELEPPIGRGNFELRARMTALDERLGGANST
jgi:hypothetical protein